MKRNSLLASIATLGLIFTFGTSAAAAIPQSGGESGDVVTQQLDEPETNSEDYQDNNSEEVHQNPPSQDEGQDEDTAGLDERPLEDQEDGNQEDGDQSGDNDGNGDLDADDEEVLPPVARMAPAPMSVGTFPDLDSLLDPSALWPLPVGVATAEPDPVFKRGTSGYHDPFVIAGSFAIPDIDLLASPLKDLLKGEMCSNPLVTSGVDLAVKAATGIAILPIIFKSVDGYSPSAADICNQYIDGLTPSQILDIVPLDVHVSMQGDEGEYRETTVPFRSVGVGVGNLYFFGATSNDFPGGYFPAQEYEISADLMANAAVTLPKTTVTTSVDWTGTQLGFPPKTVTGTKDVNLDFPPIDLDYTFTNEPLAQLLNNPTMTVIEAPVVDAAWDYGTGLRVNGDGYDGTVEGTVVFTGDLDTYNKYFRTDLLLYKVGNLTPSERVSVSLDEDFAFSHEFTGLSSANYYAVPVVSSTKFLPIPVQGAQTRLQVVDIRADFDAPVLGCLEETGNYQLEGSVHNNELKPVTVTATLLGPDGEVDSQSVSPFRTHFDINAQVGAGDYSAEFSADGARTVTIDGPSVAEGDCASFGEVAWEPAEAVNACPADTADSTLTGVVEGFGDGYEVDYGLYVATGDDTNPWEPVDGYGGDIEVAEDGSFSVDVTGLPAGEYSASIGLGFNGEWVETVSADLTVEISDCAAIVEVAWDPDEVTNVFPAETAGSTLTGQVANFSEGYGLNFELYVATDGVDEANFGSVAATGRDMGSWEQVEGYGGDIAVAEDGSFSVDVTGLPAGEYRAFVGLTYNGEQEQMAIADLLVRIQPLAQFSEVAWEPAEAANVCPADTADSTLTGQVANFGEGYVVGVGIYADGADEPITGDSDVTVNEDGSFSFEVTGLSAGSYYASVTLAYGDEPVEGQAIAVPLTVEIDDCTVDPDPDQKPDQKPDGKLPKTGASIGIVSVLAAAALGGGALLRRKRL